MGFPVANLLLFISELDLVQTVLVKVYKKCVSINLLRLHIPALWVSLTTHLSVHCEGCRLTFSTDPSRPWWVFFATFLDLK